MQVLPMGVGAALVEDPPGTPASWAAGLRAVGMRGVVDVVPAARTVLVRCENEAALRGVMERFEEVAATVPAGSDGGAVTIDVIYDGEDLGAVAATCGLSVDEIVALHSSAEYRVAFCGFAPGFGYLSGLPTELHLPRRPSPRTRVPAGSVAIAAEYTAVYPRQSPGGWHLLGRTDHVLFDVERDSPALLQPGVTVRFRPVA